MNHARFLFGATIYCFALAVAFAGPRAARAASANDAAAEILKATGVKGGLVAHLGCGDGTLTAALRVDERYIVHGLDRDAQNVARARARIKNQNTYGAVAIDHWDGERLPYIDNLVSLLVAEDLGGAPLDEVLRVLRPLGVAYYKQGGAWAKAVKPWPTDIDEWTHYLHGPDNNAVARDNVVASPRHIQWVGSPKWARNHNYLSSTSAMVSAAGRIFAIIDEGPAFSITQPPKWRLIARDAFNGVTLWQKQIGPWEGHLRPFRSGPTELQRRLVAAGDRVYVTLGYGKPLCALDAATGEIIQTYDAAQNAVEIVHSDGVLYVVTGAIDEAEYAESIERDAAAPRPRNKKLLALQAETGKLLWQKSNADTREIFPTTLCVGGERLYFHGLEHLVCLDAKSGAECWRKPRPAKRNRLGWSTPTLVAHDGVVLCADCAFPTDDKKEQKLSEVKWGASATPKRGDDGLGELIAYSAKDGAELWRCPAAQGYTSPADVFVADGLVWISSVPNLTKPDFAEGRDPRTGAVERRIDTTAAFTTTHHHRCYRNKATERFIMVGRTGTEFIDLKGETPLRHCWVRGACQYGVLPCNGLLYAPAHSCACYIQSKLTGFWALAPKRIANSELRIAKAPRLQKGPAYNKIPNPPAMRSAAPIPNQSDWPTYRHDASRSGSGASVAPRDLQRVWTTKIPGGRLTSPVTAEGMLLVASVEDHTVHALDAASGERRWSHTVGGRVDSPPTIHRGLALFGSAAGYVHCLRLADGAQVWRFRAAPADRRTVAYGQVESVWPVTGSVLVRDSVVYCTAGRSSYLDGGMRLCRLDPATGELLGEKTFYSRDPETGRQPEELLDDVEMPGALPDVLSAVGADIFWRDMRLDQKGAEQEPNVPHLYSSVGLLDDSWWHRTYWIVGTKTYGRASGWAVVANYVPSGRILVLDETTVFGFGLKRVDGREHGFSGPAHHLFRADQKVTPLPGQRRLKNNNVALTEHFVPTKINYHWSREAPIAARAMVLAGNTLFVAGPALAQELDAAEPELDRDSAALLLAFAAEDGRELARLPLDSQPVFDGLIAAGGRLYVTQKNGAVVCLGQNK